MRLHRGAQKRRVTSLISNASKTRIGHKATRSRYILALYSFKVRRETLPPRCDSRVSLHGVSQKAGGAEQTQGYIQPA